MEQANSSTCKKCGKEIASGKYCGVCQAEVREQHQKIGKYAFRAAATLGVIAIAVITGNSPSSGDNGFL